MGSAKLAVRIAVAVCVVFALAALSFVTSFGLGFPEFAMVGGVLGIFSLFALNVVLIVAAIVHALVRDDLTGMQRLIWIAIAFFITPVVAVGAIVYFALGRERTSTLFRDVTMPASRPPPPASPPGP